MVGRRQLSATMGMGLVFTLAAAPAFGQSAPGSPAVLGTPAAAASGQPAPSASAAIPSSVVTNSPTGATNKCVAQPEVSTDFVDPAGHHFGKPGSGLAKVHHFHVGSASGGTNVMQVEPPPGFSPLTATNTQLLAYGMLPRPAQPGPELDVWMQEYGHWQAPPSSAYGVCLGAATHSDYATANSWSGAIANRGSNNELRRVAADMRVPNETIACSYKNSSHSYWVGIGGWNGDKGLLQNGFFEDSFYSLRPFWEGIIHNYSDTGEVGETSNTNSVLPGDLMRADTYYYPSGNEVIFNWFNLTRTNETFPPQISFGLMENMPISSYYDGTHAEVIDERNKFLGSTPELRYFVQQGFGRAWVYPAGQNVGVIGAFNPTLVHMVGTGDGHSIAYMLNNALNADGAGFNINHDSWCS